MTSVLCPLMYSTAFIIEHICIKITFYKHCLVKCILYQTFQITCLEIFLTNVISAAGNPSHVSIDCECLCFRPEVLRLVWIRIGA